MNDLDEQAWWIITMPNAVAYVPAATEEGARVVLSQNCYPNAPVDTWPLVGSRWTSRQRLSGSQFTSLDSEKKP